MSTGFTIVRTAAKLATFVSLIPMSADPTRVEVVLHDDSRLLAAVDAIVVFAGQRVGLTEREQAGLAAATSETCAEVFSIANHNGDRGSTLRVVVSDFSNRVEVAIESLDSEHPTGPSHAAGSKAGAPSEAYVSVKAALQRSDVDRVQHEVYNHRPWTILIKYLAAQRPKQQV